MDAESNRGEQAPAESDSESESSSLPARRFTSAGNRLQATLAAADTASEEILEGARAEARELIQRAEQVATDRTAQLQTQVEILLTQANDLTQRAQQLSEATRELTSSVNRVVSVEAPAVTELELGSGEVELIARPVPPASIGTGSSPATTEQAAAVVVEEAVVEPAPSETEETSPEPETPEAEEAPPAEVVEPSPEAAEAPPVAAAPTVQAPQPPEPPAPAGPPPSQPPPPKPEQAEPAAAEEDAADSDGAAEAPRRRRSLFSRLRRGGHVEETVEVQGFSNRPRASAESISEVSPGHQMLARQMLLDGLSEEEIERRLRDEFRVQDPGAVLDSLQLSGPLIPPAKDEANE